MNFWDRNAAPRDFLGKPSASFSADPHNKVRKAIYLGKLYSLSFYSSSPQDLLKGFFRVLLHSHSLDYLLKMVIKAYFKVFKQISNLYFHSIKNRVILLSVLSTLVICNIKQISNLFLHSFKN